MDLKSAVAGRFNQNILSALAPTRPNAEASAGASPAASFQETARKTAASFVEALRQGEETAKAGMVGRADPQSVVAALASAEIAVQSAVMVRDKVVESYQEILRMPV